MITVKKAAILVTEQSPACNLHLTLAVMLMKDMLEHVIALQLVKSIWVFAGRLQQR